jgi:hypothetical protein
MRSSEADVTMANKAFNQGQFESNLAAAQAFKVSHITLRERRNGRPCRADCTPNSKKLTEIEERSIIDHALDLDTRGFQLNLDMLRDMADKLLQDRGQRRVGVN